jgi:hypothetical protein
MHDLDRISTETYRTTQVRVIFLHPFSTVPRAFAAK